ncbi:Gfo/Idh/MocA family protein [Calidifontibacillus erzurumensis]|uniref:Gfo/Idh/MocA family protein n=1 Tax=Calidifontibacillus erzurumensis TaxID=2741433 RepID=UPI0035B56621
MRKIKWGIISTANIAKTQFIPAIFRSSNAEVVAIASRGSKVHEAFSEFHIQKRYESYEQLLNDPDIDAVYIPLPNHLHKEWVLKAADHGKHILCEKPLALNAEEAREMVAYCREKKVKLMEAFMYQFHPQHDRVREIIASGEIGEVKLIKSSHSFILNNREDIRMNPEMGGGSIYDVGCYSIHVIRYILQAEPKLVRVSATIDLEKGVDTAAFASLEMENGVKALFDCSFHMFGRNEYEVIGTEGTIYVPFAFRPDFNGGIGEVIVKKSGMTRTEKITGDIYRLEVEHFSQAILDNTELYYRGEEAIKNMRVIDACYESMKTGKSVKIEN